MKSPFESKLESVLPCYETAKFSFVKMNNSEQINGAVKVDGRWTHILFFRNDVLTLNVYHDGTGNPPVTTTTKIECHSGDKNDGSVIDNVVGVNESFITEQAAISRTISNSNIRLLLGILSPVNTDPIIGIRIIYFSSGASLLTALPARSHHRRVEVPTPQGS